MVRSSPPRLPMSPRLTDRVATLESELATAKQAGDAAATAEVTRLKDALSAQGKEPATAQAELATANTGKTTAEAEVAKLTAEKKTVSEQAQEIVVGLPASRPASTVPTTGCSPSAPSSSNDELEIAKLSTHKREIRSVRRYEIPPGQSPTSNPI